MPSHKDTVSFTEAHALLWLTVLWGGSRDVWSEPTALWSGAPADGGLSLPAPTLLISATDEKAQEKDLLCSVCRRPSHASSPGDSKDLSHHCPPQSECCSLASSCQKEKSLLGPLFNSLRQ